MEIVLKEAYDDASTRAPGLKVSIFPARSGLPERDPKQKVVVLGVSRSCSGYMGPQFSAARGEGLEPQNRPPGQGHVPPFIAGASEEA